MRGVQNRSEFIRSAILAALDSVCPLCKGSGILTPDQRRHWDAFAKSHTLTECTDCHAVHLVCPAGDQSGHAGATHETAIRQTTRPYHTNSPLPSGEGQGVRELPQTISLLLFAQGQRVRVDSSSPSSWLQLLLALGCRDRDSAGNAAGHGRLAARLQVFAGIPPLGWLVQRIGGPCVEVGVLVQPGQNPHVFEPSPRQVVAMEKASTVFQDRHAFRERIRREDRRPAPRLALVDASQGIVKRRMARSADEHDEHEEPGGPDPHVWLTPGNLKIMAATIADALQKADPVHAGEFHRNQMALDRELDALDARIRRALGPLPWADVLRVSPGPGLLCRRLRPRRSRWKRRENRPPPGNSGAGEAGPGRGRAGHFPPTAIRSPPRRPLPARSAARWSPIDPLAPDVVRNLDQSPKRSRSLAHR